MGYEEQELKERKEMLRDISSIANAYGGYLIIGVEADKEGIPIKIFCQPKQKGQ